MVAGSRTAVPADPVDAVPGPGHEMSAPRLTGLDEQLCFSLYAATNTITRAYRPLLREIGLTYPQYLVMLALWDHDGVATRDVAARLDLPANALSPLLDRLEERGLVERRPDPDDRRVHRVHLTAAGDDLKAPAAGAQVAVAATTRLSREEHLHLRDLLGRLFTEGAP